MARKGTVLLIALAALCLLWWFRSASREGFQASLQPSIPNIMWTYWNSDTLPDVVQNCIDSWRRHYPTMEIRIVNPNTVRNYIDIDPKSLSWNDSPARESDIVRLLILATYGGYWSDATNYFTAPVEFPMRPETEFVGYFTSKATTNNAYPIIDSWFFGTVPGGKFITQWRDAFMSISKYGSVGNFLEAMKSQGVDFQAIGSPSYLAIHIASQYVLQKKMGAADMRSMVLLKSEDGPFAYLEANNWDARKSLEDLCNGKYVTSMIKFCGPGRGILEKDADLAKCIFSL